MKKNNDVQITFATSADLVGIIALERMCFPSVEAASEQTIRERFACFADCFLVAKWDHQVIGFINGCACDSTILKDDFYYDANLHQPNGAYQCVFGLDVHPNYRGQHIATKLLKEFIKLAKERNKKGVILTCKEYLLPFYESVGFVHLGVSNSSHGQATWNDMLLLF